MKKSIVSWTVLALAALSFVRCSDWTETEALNYEPTGNEAGTSHGDAYYANLRAYKQSDHTIAFGWYSEWTGTGTQMGSQLMGIPDSMDVVSMWGNWHGLSPEKKEDLRKVQQIKGTKVMMCFIISNIGDQTTPDEIEETLTVDGVKYNSIAEARAAFWGWYEDYRTGEVYGEDTPEAMDKALRKYANSLLDTIRVYNWDGFDFDLEPHYGSAGNIASHPDRISILLDELSKELGPKSGTGKLLCVDGEPDHLLSKDGALLDYFILQAYGDNRDALIDERIQRLVAIFHDIPREEVVGKTIICSNFESYGSTGGGSYTTRDGVQTNQLTGYAMYRYMGEDKIGGFGAFRFGFDTDFQYMRKAIGTANPVIK